MENLKRIASYFGVRSSLLLITVVVAVYLVILIANMGGHMDKIRESQIREEVGLALQSPEFQQMPEAQRRQIYEQMVEVRRREEGLDKPFFQRSLRYLVNGITLNLGRSQRITSDTGSNQVRLILVERLPHTLLLWGTAQLLLFFISVFLALYLSRHYGSALDRIVVALAPTSAPPAWFYGIILILIFASLLGLLPYGGFVDAPPPPTKLAYALSVLKHMVLPVLSVLIGGIFVSIYNWRTFFLIYSSEDYVEMARAKGLPPRTIERRYVLRPTVPPILTSFTLMLITVWMGGIITETVFAWPGLGRLLYQAVERTDTPVMVGSSVVYGYLLAMSVLFLDLAYAVFDPRVRLGAAGGRRL
jgi:peptide/nickel transport system permease protein